MEMQETPEVDELSDKIKLRREARRRKILENAKTRLEKLSTKHDGDGDSDFMHESLSFHTQETCEYSDPEVEPDIPEHLQMSFQQLEGTFTSFDTTINSEDIRESERPFLKYKLHVVLAVTVSYIVSLILNVNEGKTFFVIIPVTMVIISDITIFRQQRQHNPMINMLFIFGIRPQEIARALGVMSRIQSILRDLSIFIFYFCIAACAGNQFVHLAEVK